MDQTPSLAVVTGGSRGIGAACAKRLAADGFFVLLTYVSKPELAWAVCADIKSAGGKAEAHALDTADSAAVAAFFAAAKDKGTLDVLVNNAGITRDGLILRMKDEDFAAVLDVNLRGAFSCLREASKIMVKQRSGRIVNITSVVGLTGNAGQANYASAKAGLIGLTKSAAQELAARGITVNAVAPGFIETDMTAGLPDKVREELTARIPLKRLGAPEDVAGAVSFLVSPAASYVTGQTLSVNGGMFM